MEEENTALRSINEIQKEDILKYSVAHSEMVASIWKLNEALRAAETARNVVIGINVALALATIGGILIW